MNILHLAQIGEVTQIPALINAALALGEAIDRYAYPNNPGVKWMYGDQEKVGLDANHIAMATGAPLEEIITIGTYSPHIDRGLLFIGYPWDVFNGQAKESRDEYDTTVCVDIEGVARVILEIDPDRIPEAKRDAVNELTNLAGLLLDFVMK